MKRKITVMSALFAVSLACAQYKSEVWCPDNGDGTYTNPVINADYSDPDVIAVGDDFYMTASSFNCVPGLPILHSRDLVNWSIVGHALQNLVPDSLFDKVNPGKGVFAPSIRYHNKEFYIYWGDPDQGVYMVKTDNPAGRWSEPVMVMSGKGYIDTTPLWDDDGRCYMVFAWAGSRVHFGSVLCIVELSADGTHPIGKPAIVYDGGPDGNYTCEGPKLYKRNGYYYILCPAGGVGNGWQVALRSCSIYGPYESKTVMARGTTDINGPHQGGWVHTTSGEDWFLHFQNKRAYGRVIHLNPVTWRDGWPVMGVDKDGDYCGEPVRKYRKPKTKAGASAVCNPVESDGFDGHTLGLQWQWPANYKPTYGMPTANGSFRFYAGRLERGQNNLWLAPNILQQKLPSDAFTATAKISMAAKVDGQMGGIIMMGGDYTALAVRCTGKDFQLVQLTCLGAEKNTPETVDVLATLPATRQDDEKHFRLYEDIYLRMTVKANKRLRFSYSLDGKSFKPCGKEFVIAAGKWIGGKMGLFCEDTGRMAMYSWMDVDWFRVTKQ